MPVYEYRCPKCGEFEVEQRITEDALTSCPECGAEVKKLIPRKMHIQFKGSGFHVNDYPSGRGRSTGDPKTKEDKTSAATPEKEEVKKEVKPAAAGES